MRCIMKYVVNYLLGGIAFLFGFLGIALLIKANTWLFNSFSVAAASDYIKAFGVIVFDIIALAILAWRIKSNK